jgi:hypothetical protein
MPPTTSGGKATDILTAIEKLKRHPQVEMKEATPRKVGSYFKLVFCVMEFCVCKRNAMDRPLNHVVGSQTRLEFAFLGLQFAALL